MNPIRSITAVICETIEALYDCIEMIHSDLVRDDPTHITPIIVWVLGLPVIIVYEFFIREE